MSIEPDSVAGMVRSGTPKSAARKNAPTLPSKGGARSMARRLLVKGAVMEDASTFQYREAYVGSMGQRLLPKRIAATTGAPTM